MRVIVFLLLLWFCWPLALVLLVLFPLVWLVLLPFRLMGLVVFGVFELIGEIFRLPARALRAI